MEDLKLEIIELSICGLSTHYNALISVTTKRGTTYQRFVTRKRLIPEIDVVFKAKVNRECLYVPQINNKPIYVTGSAKL